MKADLHLHSTASDGMLEPDELVGVGGRDGFYPSGADGS